MLPMRYLNIKGQTFVIDDPFADGFGGGGGKLSDFENDVGFVTRVVADLENYYDKQTVDNKISAIPKFDVQVVQSLPESDISETTVYLVPDNQGEENLYEEYICVNGSWEKLGVQKVDMSNYYTKDETDARMPTKMSQLSNDKGYITIEAIPDSMPASDVADWAKAETKPEYNKSEIGLPNVDNVKQYSENNPPPYPVTSVNGQTGAVETEPKGTAAARVQAHNNNADSYQDIRNMIPTKVSQLSNDSGYVTETNLQPVVDAVIAALPVYSGEVL